MSYIYYLPVLAWPTAMSLVAVTVLLIAAVRWIVLPRVRAGAYSVYSGFYLRKWMVALATEVTLETLSSLYATVYMRAWYRLMGAKIGKDAEISANLAGRYDLIDDRREMLHRRRGGARRRGNAPRLDDARTRWKRARVSSSATTPWCRRAP